MPCRILVLGHSFIVRLKSFLKRNVAEHNFTLNLDPAQFMIQYSGRSGANVEKLRSDLEIVADFEPTVIVLQIGTNDLCNSFKSIEDVAGSIFALAEHLACKYHVQRVVIMQILHRLPPGRPVRHIVDTAWFNERVDAVNSLIARMVVYHRNITYWKHKGLFDASCLQEALDLDGTHLNETCGYPKYFKNIRAAIVSMKKDLDK